MSNEITEILSTYDTASADYIIIAEFHAETIDHHEYMTIYNFNDGSELWVNDDSVWSVEH